MKRKIVQLDIENLVSLKNENLVKSWDFEYAIEKLVDQEPLKSLLS